MVMRTIDDDERAAIENEPRKGKVRQLRPDPWKLLDAGAIFAPLPPLTYVIRGIDLCAGAPAIWAGYGFSMKTLSAQSAEIAIAGGLGKVWDCFAAPTGKTLHIDYEQGERLTRERFQRLAYAHSLGPADFGDRLNLVSMPQFYLDGPGADQHLERLVAGCTLVVIDSLRAACPTLDENSSEIRRALDMLTRVSERTRATFVVIHHARKPQKDATGGAKMAIRGSGALYDACGSVLVFEAEKGKPVRIAHEKARASGTCADDFELEAFDVDERQGVSLVAKGAPPRDERAEELAASRRRAAHARLVAEVRRMFAERPSLGGAKSIAAELGHREEDVRAALAVLVDGGEVRAEGTTRDRRHTWIGGEG